ncbi:MAG: hypothetical protein ACI4VQ_03610 [Clostridia bacterium]
MKHFKNNIKTIAVIIGTLVGAGFASGKEIYIFFVKYGIAGLIGAIISSILTAAIIYCTILIVKTYKLQNNNEFVEKITEKKRGSTIIKNVINLFLLISFWIMCAGFCTFFKQEFNIPIICTSTSIAIIIYLLLMKNIDGIIKLNTIMVPIMIIIIIFVSTKNNQTFNIISENIIEKKWWPAILSSILYTSYNSITLIPIIISMKECVKDKKNLKWMTIIVGLLIFGLIICIIKMLMQTTINVEQIEIPILAILNTYGKTEKMLYAIVIVVAIFTSAISAGYGALENVKGRNRYKKMALIICLLEIPISYIGFGKLVEAVYPTFGVIGILQIALILKTTNSIAKKAKN